MEEYIFRGKDFAPFFIGLFPYVNRVSNFINNGGKLPDDLATNAKIFSYMIYQGTTVSVGTVASALFSTFFLSPIAENLEELISKLF